MTKQQMQMPSKNEGVFLAHACFFGAWLWRFTKCVVSLTLCPADCSDNGILLFRVPSRPISFSSVGNICFFHVECFFPSFPVDYDFFLLTLAPRSPLLKDIPMPCPHKLSSSFSIAPDYMMVYCMFHDTFLDPWGDTHQVKEGRSLKKKSLSLPSWSRML